MEISELYNRFLECGQVTTDTRNCQQGSMFFALRGASFNGNEFAHKALESGCRYAVIDQPEYAEEGDSRLILVDNSLKAMQDMATLHRTTLGTQMIGITGTNGKTTTKELIAAVLKEKYNVLYTDGNLNNHIGVPLTLLRLTKEHEIAVIEMGANHPGEIRELTQIARPDYGLITNVGKAHLEGFGSLQGVLKTKGEMYEYIRNNKGKIFIQNENRMLESIAEGIECIRYGATDGADLKGEAVSCTPYLRLMWKSRNARHEVQTRLVGEYNIDNAMAAVTIGMYFGVDEERICHALRNYMPKNNRSQLLMSGRNKLVIDAYNANPTSMKAALDSLKNIDTMNKMVILGDMKELGDSSTEEHQKIVDILMKYRFGKVILVGTEFGKTDNNFRHFNTTDDVKEYIKKERPEGYIILIKGSNSMRMTELKEYL